MTKQSPTQNNLFRSRRSLAAGLAVALTVLAGTILWSGLQLRRQIRAQIANRDGETLDALAVMLHLEDQANGESIGSLEEPGEQLELALKVSRLRNVVGVRLFTPQGQFTNAFPAYISEANLGAVELASLRQLKPMSHFLPQAQLADQDMLAETNQAPVPLLEVNIPLRAENQTRLAGVAQFLMNGTSIAAEYRRLDQRLAGESALAFLVGGGFLAGGLALAFRRVQRANRLLAERTDNLLQANQQLALAAKTSAVGAVTSHLIHGLKNPLSGLQNFVQDRAQQNGNGHDTDWQLAVATTKRMESLINRVVGVLQQEQTATEYQVTFAELAEMVSGKLQPADRLASVRFEAVVTARGALTNREADLVLLIVENLVQNALEATPSSQTVRLSICEEAERVAIEVQDAGPGLPAAVQERLFTPCSSTKKGGSGIGLAISRQLANHLGAELTLKRSSPEGCVFRLTLPPLGVRESGNLSGRQVAS